ncbi:MAG: phosphate signaling complex protein PhoU [Verrucomicrobia bacterium]|nr:phosphate signaling complex protein PhoU [Verrucomicrobiota bacterium]
MSSLLDASLQRDIDRIRTKVMEMGKLAVGALNDCLKAVTEVDRELAYAVILRDQYVDEKEKEIDRLCLEFLVRQQPVAQSLRLAYCALRINLELERVGDYAESIARQLLKLKEMPASFPKDEFTQLAQHAIAMLDDATKAFVGQDAELARKTIELEDGVDLRKSALIKNLVHLFREGRLPFEALDPLTMMVRRYERVADQARNICTEVLYLCTGEYAKHPGSEVFRVLFIDEHDDCLTKISEAVANALGQSKFIFTSAGLDPRPVGKETLRFLESKGLDPSYLVSRALHQVPNLDHYHLIIALSPEVKKRFPRRPRKGVYLDWSIENPARASGSPEEVHAAFDRAYRQISESVNQFVQAVLKS